MKYCVILLSVVVGFSLLGCGKKQPTSEEAAQQLEQSFQTEQPVVQQKVTTAVTSLKAGNYTEAARALEPVVSGRPLTDSQREAVSVALQQINAAIEADRSLDTKEMYNLRAKMFEASHPRSKY